MNIPKIKDIVETSRTLKEALERNNTPVTFHQRELLKNTIKQNNWTLNKFPNKVGTSGVWKDLSVDEFKTLIQNSTCFSDALRKLGLSTRGATSTTLKKYITRYNLNILHFSGKATKGRCTTKIPADKLFQQNSPHDTSTVRKWILRDELIPYICNKCGISPLWNDNPLTLQLEHTNGDNTDHRLSNLEFLCPNCHSQTKTWGRKRRE